ncbi:MAG: hypothetical protein V1728_00500 [Candidatus Micrarchaeota archaeon]
MKNFILFSLMLALAILLSGTAWADAQASYSVDGLTLTRSLSVREIGHLDFSTGAISNPWYESTVTLNLKNNGPAPHTNIVLEENLAYLPANAHLSYTQSPSSAGRKASWSIPLLSPGEEFTVNITVMALVPDSAIGAQGPPGLEYARPPASLQAPPSADQGAPVLLRLIDDARRSVPGAQIEVSSPDGRIRILATDSTGYARFDASLPGVYTYRVPAYTLDFVPSTQSLAPAPVLPAVAGAMVPPNPPPAGSGALSDNFLFIASLLVGAVLVAIIGLALLGFMSRSQVEPDGSEHRSVIEEDSGIELSSSRTDKGPRGASSLAQAPGPSHPASYSLSSASSAPGSPSAASYSISASTAAPSGEESLPEQTRRLLASRRSASPTGSASGEARVLGGVSPPIPMPHPADRADPAAEDDSDWTERTTVKDAPAPGPEAKRSGYALRTPAGGEDEEGADRIDDEAIRKTIEELEQLRAQLQARSSATGEESGAEPQNPDEEPGEDESSSDNEPEGESAPTRSAAPPGEEPERPEQSEDEAPEPLAEVSGDIDLGRIEREEEEDLTREGISVIDEQAAGAKGEPRKPDQVQTAIEEIEAEEEEAKSAPEKRGRKSTPAKKTRLIIPVIKPLHAVRERQPAKGALPAKGARPAAGASQTAAKKTAPAVESRTKPVVKSKSTPSPKEKKAPAKAAKPDRKARASSRGKGKK